MDTPDRDTGRKPRSKAPKPVGDQAPLVDPRRKYKRRATDSLSDKDSNSGNEAGSSMSDSEEHELGPIGSDADVDEETGLTGKERRKYVRRKRRQDGLDTRIAGAGGLSKDDARQADELVMKRLLTNAALIAMWYLFSLSISIYNKWMFSSDHLDFHFPMFTTSLHMVVQFLLASTILLIFPSLRPSTPQPAPGFNPKSLITPLFYLTRLVPTGTTTSLDIGLGNTSLQYITLTFYTMCKSSVLIFVLIFAFLFRLEKPSLKLVLIILTMTAGVLMMVAGETAFNALGFSLAMSASFFSGFRWALTQILLLRHPATSNPFSTLFFLAPIMFFTLFTIAIFSEKPNAVITGIYLLAQQQGVGRTFLLLLVPGCLAFCMIASEFTLLKRTSVVTLSICGIFKEVVTISAAGIAFHDKLSAINVSGLLVTICAIACYNYLKITSMRQEARDKLAVKANDSDEEEEDDDEAIASTPYDQVRDGEARGSVERASATYRHHVAAIGTTITDNGKDGFDHGQPGGSSGGSGGGGGAGSISPSQRREDLA